MADQLDILFSQLGTGKWNLFHYFAVGYAISLPVPHALAGPFLAPRLKYKCHMPPGSEDDFFNTSSTDSSPCSYSVRNPDGFLEEEEEKICTQWDFENSTFTNTITSEFQLVCQKEYIRVTYQSMLMIGVLVGSPINGILADRFGRKTTFAGGCFLFTTMANISCWLPNISSILAFRFLLGIVFTPMLKTGFIMAVEITDPKVRSVVGIMQFLPWAFGTIAWGGVAYLQRSWRYLQLAVSLPGLLLLPVLWFMDESPRWLTVRGQHRRALRVLRRAARWNNVILPPDEEIIDLLRQNSDELSEVSKTKVCDKNRDWKSIIREYVTDAIILFRTPRLRLASMVMHLNYLVLGMVFYGIALSGGNFQFNIFTYIILMGLMEFPAYTVLAPIVLRFGRKMPIAACYFLSGSLLLALPFVPSSKQWIVVTIAMIGKMAIAMAFQGNNLFATELFPTEVRTRGVSSSFMLSRLGSALAPVITDYVGLLYPWAPSVIFGGFAAVAGFATLTLWETVGMALPCTVTQLESTNFNPTRRSFRRLPTSECEFPTSKIKATKV